MPQPKGQKRIPGHALRTIAGLAACECGWATDRSITPSAANRARTQHLVDLRMERA